MSSVSYQDRCGHCDKDLNDTDVLMKPCSCCGLDRYLHAKCARKYFSWYNGVSKEKFAGDKFQARLLRFFCVSCQTKVCPFCAKYSKKHNVGEPSSFPVVCFHGHWFVATRKCAPEFKVGKFRKWFCPIHANQQQTNAVCGLEEPRGVLQFSLPKYLYKQTVGSISKWYSDGSPKDLSYFKTKILSKFVSEDFFQKTLDKFRILTEYGSRIHPNETKKDKARKNLNKEFMDHILSMNRFSPFTDERGNYKSQLCRDILAPNTEEPFPVVSPEAMLSMHRCGKDGFIEEKVLDYFYFFLQELILTDNSDKTKKVPHVFMEPTYLERISPPTSIFLNADFELLFEDDPKVIICEYLHPSNWYNNEDNRKAFGHEYKHWFENYPKFKYDDAFDKLDELNEVRWIHLCSCV